jgi:hypothetical protein
MTGIPFIGEEGYYPEWAGISGRWLFQRTLISVGQILGDIARLHAAQVPEAEQIIVWAPKARVSPPTHDLSSVHNERQLALNQLHGLTLVCYGDQCDLPKPGECCVQGIQTSSVIREYGVHPEQWALVCPSCGDKVGPDLGIIGVMPIINRWLSLNRPQLENPGAASTLKSAPAITDLPTWVQQFEPSHLELAYVGQQMWSDIPTMFIDMDAA